MRSCLNTSPRWTKPTFCTLKGGQGQGLLKALLCLNCKSRLYKSIGCVLINVGGDGFCRIIN